MTIVAIFIISAQHITITSAHFWVLKILFYRHEELRHHCAYYFITLNDDIHGLKECYVVTGNIFVVFDSGCIVAVNPFRKDFIGNIKYVKKTMNRLSYIAKLKAEEKWFGLFMVTMNPFNMSR